MNITRSYEDTNFVVTISVQTKTLQAHSWMSDKHHDVDGDVRVQAMEDCKKLEDLFEGSEVKK